MNLLKKIEDRQALVSIIGLGHVGLPLAVVFAEAGFRVVGIEVDEARVKAINQGKSYIQDVSSQQLARWTKRPPGCGVQDGGGIDRGHLGSLSATTEFDVLQEADAAIICVPTPLGKTKDPDISRILAATEQIAKRLHPGMLVILESTTFPGTTYEVLLPLLEEVFGQELEVGKDFYLAFSPERVDPGNTEWTISDTPKVVGGVTPECLNMAQALYQCAVRQVVPVSSPKVAEMVKLLENTFRATNIALVNEFAIMCDRLGVDVWEVIEAAKTKPFGFMPFYPGPGLGGHCIPVDPQYLAWKLKTLDYNARFIQLAAEINFEMPTYVLGKITDALNQERKPLKGSRLLVLGVTYKADVGDLRESPALDLIELLHQKGAEVSYHDPYVPQFEVDGLSLTRVSLSPETLRQADCVIITTSHKSYDWNWVVQNSRLVMDTRNATKGIEAESTRVVKL